MKKKLAFRRNSGLKILLTFLYAFSSGAAAAGCAVSLYLYEDRYYASDVENLSHNLMNDICADDMYALYQKFEALKYEGYFKENTSEQLREKLYEGFMDGYSQKDTNFFFTICDMEDNVLLTSNPVKTDYQCAQVQVFQDSVYDTVNLVLSEEEMSGFDFPENAVNTSVETAVVTSETIITEEEDTTNVALTDTEIPLQFDENGAYMERFDTQGNRFVIRFDENGVPYAIEQEPIPMEMPEPVYEYRISYQIPRTENAYYISGYVRSEFTARDRYSNVRNTVLQRYKYRYVFPVCAVCGTFLALLCMIWLIWSAGYSKAKEAPGATIFEKIPLDLFTAILGGISLLVVYASDFVNDGYTAVLYVGAAVILWMLLILWWLMSIAMRIRTKSILTNNLIYMLCTGLWQLCKACKTQTSHFLSALPLIWQAGAAAVVFLIVHTIATLAMRYSMLIGMFILIPLYGATLFYVLMITWNLRILEKGGQQLAEGNLSDKIEEAKLTGHFRQHAQHLNSIGEGMNKAVSDRLKSEMFRTELISNVSHDIRTPLTSIINYTNLLAGLHLENEKALEYIDVLSRQSERLRKLTEDVLEASKATTGNIKVNKEIMDLRVLLEQMEGEYSERLEEKKLTLIKGVPDMPQYISVDGRLLWRVMDNLFGNICKYAMEGTRVYLNTFTIDNEVICMIRNISGAQLNISADALMERFVQGDRSRNTEGSGLGLSIAQSLTSLQGGRMELQIDGDLFKVTLHFPSAAHPSEKESTSAERGSV